jgi:predicted amidohydrolase YtcJ
MLADLVLVDRDPFQAPPDQLPDLSVLATLVGGRIAHVSSPGIRGIL